MYFDFEDRRPDTPILERPLTGLEQFLLTVIGYLLLVIAMIVYPRLPFVKAWQAAHQQELAKERRLQLQQQQPMEYVFAEPKIEVERLPKLPKFLSDESHVARSTEKVRIPKNDLPAAKGNSFEKKIAPPKSDADETKNTAPAPTPSNAMALPTVTQGTIARNDPPKTPTMTSQQPMRGLLSDAIRHVDRYSDGQSLQNVQGNGDFGPSIQFDTKGVDFGPWMRRFIAQIRRNWFVPYAAMSLQGHVVLSFNVHKDGSITDLQVMQPSTIDSFTKSAFNAIKLSNPTVPFPPEYPDEQGRFIVTFYFNEQPPGGGGGQ